MISSDSYWDNIFAFHRYQFLQFLLSFLTVLSSASQLLVILFNGQPTQFFCDAKFIEASSDCTNVKCHYIKFVTDTQNIITKYKLVCSEFPKLFYLAIAQLIGMIIAYIIYGLFSDRFGRRRACLISGLNTLICSLIATLAPNFETYAIFRVMTAVGSAGQFSTALTYIFENAPSNLRRLLFMLCTITWPLSLLFLCLLFYSLRDQFNMDLVITLLSLFCIAIFLYCYESPRWLVSQGRINEAKTVCSKISVFNRIDLKIHIDALSSMELTQVDQNANTETDPEKKRRSSCSVMFFRSGLRRAFLLLGFIMSINYLIYYGLAYRSLLVFDVTLLYYRMLIHGIVGVAIYLVLMPAVMYTKILRLTIIGYCLIAIVVIAYYILHASSHSVVNGVSALADAMISYLLCVESLYIMETFPTPHRNLGIGICHAMTRIGSSLGAVTTKFESMWIINTIFIICCIIVIFAKLFLHESNAHPCPDSISEAEANIRQNCYFQDLLRCVCNSTNDEEI